jgi:hypothetical protein
MPTGWIEWAMFLYFAGGALGGWALLVTLVYEAWRLMK